MLAMIQDNDIELNELANDYCTLALLNYSHCDDLIQAAYDGELWNLQYATIPKPNAMEAEIRRRLDLLHEGSMIPFSVIHNETQKIVGMTTYCKINFSEKKLDIGWTWYAKSHQRTALNTNCKLLLLAYAFERMDIETVYFKVHVNNFPSQTAVLRLGASFIDIIKNYQTMPGKEAQEYKHYCIKLADWPRIRENLVSLSGQCVPND
jgi:RimJ/RimL family protein N-acetyltransferase